MPRKKSPTPESDGYTRHRQWPPYCPKPDRQVFWEEWSRECQKELPEFWPYLQAEVILYTQLMIEQIKQPMALMLVGPPSCGKTVSINSATICNDLCIVSDRLSGPAYLTAATGKTEEELQRIDLLPRIRFRVHIMKDMAPVFGSNADSVRNYLGTLTIALDGQGLTADMGSQPRRELKGDYRYMMLGATTPMPKRIWDEMATLGPRILFMNVRTADESEEQVCKSIWKDEKLAIQKIAHLTDLYIRTLWWLTAQADNLGNVKPCGFNWPIVDGDPEITRWLYRAGRLVAMGRASAHETDLGEWNAEKTFRAAKLMRNIAMGSAIAHDGRLVLLKEDLAPVLEIAVETGRERICHVTRALVRCGGTARLADVVRTAKCGETGALSAMEMAAKMGIGLMSEDRTRPGLAQKIITVKGTPLEWLGSDEMKSLMWPDKGL